jgi:hypothetical protein
MFKTFDKRILDKYVEKIQRSLKSDKNNGHFTSLGIFRSLILRMRNFSDKVGRENQNTHFVFNNFFFENHAVYDLMWKNIVEKGASHR